MNSLYIIIGVMTLALECGKTDTSSIFTKSAHLTLFIGCVIAYFTHLQDVFMLGVILTLGCELKNGYRRRNSRASDKYPKKRKLFS